MTDTDTITGAPSLGAEPSVGALKVARQDGGAAGELIERIAWMLDPEAFQIWEREYLAARKAGGPTHAQLLVGGRRERARATAAAIVAGPLAQAVAAAREEGRVTGLEEAARHLVAEAEKAVRALPADGPSIDRATGRRIAFTHMALKVAKIEAEAIRALIPTPAHTKADPTREALKLAMRFVDRCAGEGLSFDADYEAPAANAVDVCIAIADVLGIEKLDSDAYRDLVAYPPTTAQTDTAPGGRA